MLTDTQRERIVGYYRSTQSSFANWGEGDAYMMHYGCWDRTGIDHGAALCRMDQVLADLVDIGADDRVLDAGCGVGGSSVWLAENRQARVVGVSLCKEQIDLATAAAERRGLGESLSFHVADYTDSPFHAGSFDVVWGVESICHAPAKADFIREAYRLLSPGGRLVVADYFLEADSRSAEDQWVIDKWIDGWALGPLETPQSFEAMLLSAGFHGIGWKDLTQQVWPSSEEMFARGKDGYPTDLILRRKDPTGMRHVEACMFQHVAMQRGLWRYRVVTAEKPATCNRCDDIAQFAEIGLI